MSARIQLHVHFLINNDTFADLDNQIIYTYTSILVVKG